MMRLRNMGVLAGPVLLIAACQSQPGPGASSTPNPSQTAFATDAGDPCSPERQQLEHYGQKIESPVQGLLDVGFAIGGVLDSIRQTGRVGGRITSDGITVAGGYIEALRQENGTILDLMRDATRDIEAENQRIDALIAAFDELGNCRKAGASAIRADYQAGKINRADGAAAMIALRGLYRQDISRMRELVQQVSTNTETYAAVYNDIAEDNDADALELGPYRKEAYNSGRPSARVVKRRKPRKRASPKGSLTAQAPAPEVKPQVQQMQDQLLTNVRKRDTVINRIETAEADTGDLDLALLWFPAKPKKLPT